MLEWRPLYPGLGSILLLMLGTDELARVAARADGKGWLSEVGRHRRDWRRRLSRVAPSRAAAMRWALRWTEAQLERIRAELPRTVPGKGCAMVEWPATNPAFDFSARTSPIPGASKADGGQAAQARS